MNPFREVGEPGAPFVEEKKPMDQHEVDVAVNKAWSRTVMLAVLVLGSTIVCGIRWMNCESSEADRIRFCGEHCETKNNGRMESYDAVTHKCTCTEAYRAPAAASSGAP